MDINIKILAITCSTLFLSTIAEAKKDTHSYLGAFYGNANYDASDKDEPAYRLLMGYHFNDYLSIEGGYANLGESFDDSNIDGFITNLIASLPITNDFSIYGKAGVSYWGTLFNSDWDSPDLDEDHGTFYGLGISYKVENFTIRTEYELFKNEFEDNELFYKDSDEVEVFSVGFIYNF